ncbi:MAG: hypothetical protein AABY00_02500 [Nanoarchaeota archaeon]
MKNLLTFAEISELVRCIPSHEWEHSFSGDAEHLEVRMERDELSLSLFGDQGGHRTGKASIALDTAKVELSYVNGAPLVKYTGSRKVQELFYETRRRVDNYSEFIENQTTREKLGRLGVSQSIIDKISTAKP